MNDPLLQKYSRQHRNSAHSPGRTARRLRFAPSSPQHPTNATYLDGATRQPTVAELMQRDGPIRSPSHQESHSAARNGDTLVSRRGFERLVHAVGQQYQLQCPASLSSPSLDNNGDEAEAATARAHAMERRFQELEIGWHDMARRVTKAEALASATAAELQSVEARCGWAEEQLREHAKQMRESTAAASTRYGSVAT